MKKLTFSVLALLGVLTSDPAWADRRHFAFVYEPKTMGENDLELEYYMTTAVRRNLVDGTHNLAWSHQVELEYGITDRFDVSMYQVFDADSWEGYKLRGRWRPFHTGEMPIDSMLYLELIQNAQGEIAFEEKLILGRNFGPLILTLETSFEQGPIFSTVGHKWSESLGVGYEIAPWFSVGVETQLRGRWEPKTVYTSPDPVLEWSGLAMYAGPALSFATGKFWWDVSFAARGAGEDAEARYLFRVLWGVWL